jgi:hypothetical protein
MEAFQVQPDGNFEDESTQRKTGANILHLKEDLTPQFEQELEMLRIERESRIRPGLDDKALVGWNGLMIGSLSDAGMWPLAQNAVVGVLAAEKSLGHFPHQIAQNQPSGHAYLDDYAFFIQGLLKLAICVSFLEEHNELPAQGIPSDVLIAQAVRLCQEMVAKFYDEENGGFFATSTDHELGWMVRAPQATQALYTAAISLIAGFEPQGTDPAMPAIEIVSTAPVAEAAPKQKIEVAVKISAREIPADSSGIGSGKLTISIPDGFHLNSPNPPARWLTPTKIQVKGAKAEITYPEAVDDKYEGQIEIPFAVHLPTGESGIEFELTLSYQACTESECLAPTEKVFTAVVVR